MSSTPITSPQTPALDSFVSSPGPQTIRDPQRFRSALIEHIEYKWKKGVTHHDALFGLAVGFWLRNGDVAGLTEHTLRILVLDTVKRLQAGEDTSKLKGELYPAHWRPASMKEILNRVEEPLRWIIDPLLLENASNLTSGQPHAGKSLAWLAAAMQAAYTRKVWGKFQVSPGVKRVLYVETEDPRVLVETRVRELAKHMGAADVRDLYDAGFYLATTGPFDLVKVKDQIYRLLDEYKPDLVVLSTLQGLLGGRDWNAQDEMADVNAMLVDLGRNLVPLSVITHSPKDPKLHRAAGTITQEANHATVMHFQKKMLTSGPGKGKDLLTVSVDSKMFPVPAFELLIDSELAPTSTNSEARKLISVSLAGEDVSVGAKSASASNSKDECRRKISEYVDKNPDATDRAVADAVECGSRELVRRVKKDLESDRIFDTSVVTNAVQ